ncbi:MAG: hypothetical protein HF978_03925 [Desulfobacteraceae bacterium]|nr:zinc ribbon domain-containing protein [Desulfobacteraceae bacterium]MBC2754676.1 hypothetical protein [Desulfobacteraceae bacterium]
MPIYEYLCHDCGKTCEILFSNSMDKIQCTHCGSDNVKKLFSAHSSMSGNAMNSFPGAGDTTCCGSSPSEAYGSGHCAGPGSCCGKA